MVKERQGDKGVVVGSGDRSWWVGVWVGCGRSSDMQSSSKQGRFSLLTLPSGVGLRDANLDRIEPETVFESIFGGYTGIRPLGNKS